MVLKIAIKRIQILLLVMLLVAGCFLVSAQAASVSDFTDVSANAWYYDSVSFAVSKGLFQGMSATRFGPDQTMTRAMFITVLGRFAGVDAEEYLVSGERIFTDVDYNDYYAGYAVWAYEKGIVNGMGSAEKFAPSGKVTREQICSLLNRYISHAGLSLAAAGDPVSFEDAGSISDWAAADVDAMQRYGIVMGEKSGTGYIFRPGSNATRAEVATMFQRLIQSAGDNATATDTPTATQPPQGEAEDEPSMPKPSDITDTPATYLDETISIPTDIIRVGLYMSTRSYDTCLSKVILTNTNGTGFEYGSFDAGRAFMKAGSIDSAVITITADGTSFTVKDASGNVVYTGSGHLAVHPVSEGKALTRVNDADRYYGDFELRQAYNAPGYITVINYVNIEDYVKGVIPYEYSPSWPVEALKAAAITARNFAITADWDAYSDFGFDITYNSQIYYGRGETRSESYFATTDSAVDSTSGVFLTYSAGGSNKLCTTYYHSSSGGATEDCANIWGSDLGYLVGKLDPYESAAASKASNYSYSITNTRTGSTLGTLADKYGLGVIAKDGIRIEMYADTGNVKRVTVTDVNGNSVEYTGSDRLNFLKDFGFTAYSYRFKVTYDEPTDSFTCTRFGWGHNVGLSQWGAYAMAAEYGKDYQDILGFYYTGTHLQYGDY